MSQQQREGHAGGLLGLPVEVQSFLFGRLDAASLARLSTTCSQMRRRVDRVSGLRLLEKVARDKLVARHGQQQAERWRCGPQPLTTARCAPRAASRVSVPIPPICRPPGHRQRRPVAGRTGPSCSVPRPRAAPAPPRHARRHAPRQCVCTVGWPLAAPAAVAPAGRSSRLLLLLPPPLALSRYRPPRSRARAGS
jgi:hypothetical protein